MSDEIRTTATHWRQGGHDYGWPTIPGVLVATYWAPHGNPIDYSRLWRRPALSAEEEAWARAVAERER